MTVDLKKRLAALEGRRIPLVLGRCTQRDDLAPDLEVFCRVRTALDVGLTPLEQEYDDAVHDLGRKTNTPSFGDRVRGLRDRILANTMTPEDHHVIELLPTADLQQINSSAYSIVAAYAQLYDDL